MELFKPEFQDMIPADDGKRNPLASRGAYVYCHVIWFISLAAIPVFALFTRAARIYFVAMLLPTVVACVLSGMTFTFKSGFSMPRSGKFGTLVLIVLIVSLVITIASAVTLNVYGGGSPESVPDGYAMISHNDIVRPISEREYKLLCVLEAMEFSAGFCIFNSAALLFARSGFEKNTH